MKRFTDFLGMLGTSPERETYGLEASVRIASSLFAEYLVVQGSGGIKEPKSVGEQSGTSSIGTSGIELSPHIVSEGTN